MKKPREFIRRNLVKYAIISAIIIVFIIFFFGCSARKAKNGSEESGSKSHVSSPKRNGTGQAENDDSSVLRCPVCGKPIDDPERAEFRHELEDGTGVLYFDTEKCYRAYLDNPEKYIRYNVRVRIQPGSTPGEILIEDIPVDSPIDADEQESGVPAEEVPDSTRKPPVNENEDEDEGTYENPQDSYDSPEDHFDLQPPPAGTVGPPAESVAPPSGSGKPSPGVEIEDIDVNKPMATPQNPMLPGKNAPDLKITPIAPPPGGENNSY